MRFSEIYRSRPFGLSFELFPPKSESGIGALMTHVQALMRHEPGFITCTYGAGGSTRERTLEIVSTVRQQFQVPVASHLTCVGATVEQLRQYLTQARERGIDNIVALRGDPPRGETCFSQVPGGLRYANELVRVIREEFPNFGIAVAGYPEKHQEAPSMDADLANLCRKVDAGAEVVITQLFFNNDDFFSFRDRCEQLGVRVPIIPGLLPVTNLSQIQRITSLCGSRLPKRFVERLSERDDEAWQFEVGVDYAVEQLRQLLEQGIRGAHFYVLNKSQATCRVLESALPARTDDQAPAEELEGR